MKTSVQIFASLIAALGILSQSAMATYIHTDSQFNIDSKTIDIETKNRIDLMKCSDLNYCIKGQLIIDNYKEKLSDTGVLQGVSLALYNTSFAPAAIEVYSSDGKFRSVEFIDGRRERVKQATVEQVPWIKFSISRNLDTLRQDLFKWEQGVSQNSYIIRNNVLKITAAPGTDAFPNTEPRILYPISGDFEATVKVKFRSNTNYQRATLGIRDIHGGAGLMRLSMLEGQRIEAGFYPENNTVIPNNIRNYPYEIAYLKIKKQNGFLTASYSKDKNSWSYVMKRKMAINSLNTEIFLSVLSTDSKEGCAAEFSELNIRKI
jgi:hypothetical protein